MPPPTRLSSSVVALVAAAVFAVVAASALASDIGHSNWSETAASNNATPPNGWPSGTMTPVQVEPAAREMMAAIKRFYNHINMVKTSTGAADAQVLTYDVAPAAYVSGDCYSFKAGYTNAGVPTMNVNALGAKTIKAGTTALVGGEIVAGRMTIVCYDGTDFQLLTGWGGLLGTITLNSGTNFGITAPGAMGSGSAYTIGSTSDQLRFAGLALGGAATGANRVTFYGATSGYLELKPPAIAGTNTLTLPAGTTDFSATGGTSQVVKQTAAGGAFTVARLACSDLSDSAAGCSGAAAAAAPLAIGWVANVSPNKAVIANINASSTVTAIVGNVDDAVGATAAITVYKAPSGTACASGTALHSGTFDANGTADTNQTLTVTTSALSAGDRLCLSTADGANFLVGSGIGGITVFVTTP